MKCVPEAQNQSLGNIIEIDNNTSYGSKLGQKSLDIKIM